jgi:hypothetical protein
VALCFGERSADALQADPLGSEQELVQPLGVDDVAVAGGYPGGLLGLDEWPDERGEADEPAAHAGAQPEAVVEAGLADRLAPDFFASGEVVDEAVF